MIFFSNKSNKASSRDSLEIVLASRLHCLKFWRDFSDMILSDITNTFQLLHPAIFYSFGKTINDIILGEKQCFVND